MITISIIRFNDQTIPGIKGSRRNVSSGCLARELAMTLHVIPDLDRAFSTISRGAALLLQRATAILAAIEDRRAVLHLAEADDRFLKDIGLLRSDVDGALAEPFYRKSSVLLTRSAERHARAEAMRTAETVRQFRLAECRVRT
jgi:uncharacterized protein YjiS (DUF1127 family)